MSASRTEWVAAPPRFIVGAVLLFWGAMTQHYVVALLLAVLLELRHFVWVRWEISNQLFGRIWNFCTLLFLVLAVFSITRAGLLGSIYVFVTWLPVVLLPITLAELFSTSPGIPVTSFSAIANVLRRAAQRRGEHPGEPRRVSVVQLYGSFALVSASTANQQNPVFYIAMLVFLGWALWGAASRPKMNPLAWGTCLLIVAGFGYVGHIGLHNLHLYLEQGSFLFSVQRVELDSELGFTRIGQIRNLKLSPSIVWRVKPLADSPHPSYLRTSSHNVYHDGMWYNPDFKTFVQALQEGNEEDGNWRMTDAAIPETAARLAVRGKAGRLHTTLAVPGTLRGLRQLPATSVSRNGMGVVRTNGTKRLLAFETRYDPTLIGDAPPVDRDLSISKRERAGIARVASTLKLDGLTPREIVNALSVFFAQNFEYSLDLEISDNAGPPPVVRFLESDRRGHCEYFATATVLLLRQAGIPSRYVVGFGVSEYDRKRKAYRVRGTHAHAWVQAWIDGKWEIVENTPASWAEEDQEILSWMQPLKDWFQNMPLAFSDWKQDPAGQLTIKLFKWGALPLLGLWLWLRLFKGQQSRRVTVAQPAAVPVECPGLDSEYYQLEQRLTDLLGWRSPGEPLRAWWTRLSRHAPAAAMADVDRIIEFHYRLRFDPAGLDADSRQEFAALVEECRERLTTDYTDKHR